MEEGYTVMEAAIPISSVANVKVEGRIGIGMLNACRAAKVVHLGSYENLNAPHYALSEWITENDKQMAGAPWEVYLKDLNNEPDTSKWITEIYYPFL